LGTVFGNLFLFCYFVVGVETALSDFSTPKRPEKAALQKMSPIGYAEIYFHFISLTVSSVFCLQNEFKELLNLK
jgi:hypothetical protein